MRQELLAFTYAVPTTQSTILTVFTVPLTSSSYRVRAERRGYKNVFNALARISKEEGVTALWRGFEPTVRGGACAADCGRQRLVACLAPNWASMS